MSPAPLKALPPTASTGRVPSRDTALTQVQSFKASCGRHEIALVLMRGAARIRVILPRDTPLSTPRRRYDNSAGWQSDKLSGKHAGWRSQCGTRLHACLQPAPADRVLRSTRNVLPQPAGEQEDFRPLFLPGPPALVLWSGAVPRGLSQSNVRQNATVCIRGEPLSAGSPAGRGFQRRGPKFQPGPGAQPGHPTIFPPPAGGNAPGRRPAATRGARRAGFTTRPAPGDWNDAILRSAARISR